MAYMILTHRFVFLSKLLILLHKCPLTSVLSYDDELNVIKGEHDAKCHRDECEIDEKIPDKSIVYI